MIAEQSGKALTSDQRIKHTTLKSVATVPAPPERTAGIARRGERARSDNDEIRSDSGESDGKKERRESVEQRGGGGEETGGDGGEESGEDGGDDGDEGRSGNRKEAAGHGGSDGMEEEEDAARSKDGREEDTARKKDSEAGKGERQDAAAKGRGRVSNGSREGAKPARPDDGPPSGKMIVTSHKSPRHGGSRERKRKASSELPSSSDKSRRSEDGAEGGKKKKKGRYKPVESSALCSYFEKEHMDAIGRRFSLMLIMRDGMEIQRKATHRILNMAQLILAAEDTMHSVEAANFESEIMQSFRLNTDQ